MHVASTPAPVGAASACAYVAMGRALSFHDMAWQKYSMWRRARSLAHDVGIWMDHKARVSPGTSLGRNRFYPMASSVTRPTSTPFPRTAVFSTPNRWRISGLIFLRLAPQEAVMRPALLLQNSLCWVARGVMGGQTTRHSNSHSVLKLLYLLELTAAFLSSRRALFAKLA